MSARIVPSTVCIFFLVVCLVWHGSCNFIYIFEGICKSCAEVCHKGHNVVEYLHAHKPTWGCCYCVKKGTCILHKA